MAQSPDEIFVTDQSGLDNYPDGNNHSLIVWGSVSGKTFPICSFDLYPSYYSAGWQPPVGVGPAGVIVRVVNSLREAHGPVWAWERLEPTASLTAYSGEGKGMPLQLSELEALALMPHGRLSLQTELFTASSRNHPGSPPTVGISSKLALPELIAQLLENVSKCEIRNPLYLSRVIAYVLMNYSNPRK